MDIEPVRKLLNSIPVVLYLVAALLALVTALLCLPVGG